MLLHCCCHPCANSQILVLLGEGRILSERYTLLPVDLRDLGALQSLLHSAGFQPNVPTFVLAECVLVYMEPQESAALVKHLGQQLSSAVCVVYEQVAKKCISMYGFFSRYAEPGRGLCIITALCPFVLVAVSNSSSGPGALFHLCKLPVGISASSNSD